MPALIRTAGENDRVTKNVKLDYPDGLDSTGVTNILKVHRHKNYTGAQVLYYRRHADGIICCFQNSHDAAMFFQYLNKCHPTIKFRMETETDGKLPFLDVLLSKQRSSNNECPCITSVFLEKQTYTGLLTNYFSFTSFQYKSGLIKTLIDRAYKINNTTHYFET